MAAYKGSRTDREAGNKRNNMALRRRTSKMADLEEGSPEYSVVQAIQTTREKLQITQGELARRTGIDQGDISKLERGTRNPSLKLLKRLAKGLGMELKITFVPIEDFSSEDDDKNKTIETGNQIL